MNSVRQLTSIIAVAAFSVLPSLANGAQPAAPADGDVIWIQAENVPQNAEGQDDPLEDQPLEHQLARRGTARVADAYAVFVALAIRHGKLPADLQVDQWSFQQHAAWLRQLCVIDENWDFGADHCLRRDTLAYMAASYLCIRPGLLTGVLGMTQRYAHREMVYQEVIAPGPPKTFVSGSELLSVSTRVAQRVKPNRTVRLTPDEIH